MVASKRLSAFLSVFLLTTMVCSIAHASKSGDFGGVLDILHRFNAQIRLIGKALAVTGLMGAAVSYSLGLGHLNKCFSAMGGGILIASAQGIIDTFMVF